MFFFVQLVPNIYLKILAVMWNCSSDLGFLGTIILAVFSTDLLCESKKVRKNLNENFFFGIHLNILPCNKTLHSCCTYIHKADKSVKNIVS